MSAVAACEYTPDASMVRSFSSDFRWSSAKTRRCACWSDRRRVFRLLQFEYAWYEDDVQSLESIERAEKAFWRPESRRFSSVVSSMEAENVARSCCWCWCWLPRRSSWWSAVERVWRDFSREKATDSDWWASISSRRSTCQRPRKLSRCLAFEFSAKSCPVESKSAETTTRNSMVWLLLLYFFVGDLECRLEMFRWAAKICPSEWSDESACSLDSSWSMNGDCRDVNRLENRIRMSWKMKKLTDGEFFDDW